MSTLSPQLQSLMDNRLRYLPDVVGKAINSIDWSNELITIGKHYGLHIDEMEEFQSVVLKSMIGMIPPEQFESSLISAIAVSPKDAEKIIQAINEKILEPVHNFIMHPDAKTDPLKTSGIMVEPTTFSDENTHFEVLPTPSTQSTHEFEVPASPESAVPEKTFSYSDFF